MTLTGFLLARIAEDEGYARDNPIPDGSPICWDCNDVATDGGFAPVRVLAECEAKRRVIAAHDDAGAYGPGAHLCEDVLTADRECQTLRAVAAIYADHSDYDESWRP